MSFLNLLENESLAAWLANSAGQLIIISILGFIAVKLLSGKSAPARSVTAAGALVSMLLVFILSVVFQASNIAWYKADVSRFTTAQPPATEKPVEKAPIVVKPAVAAASEQMAAPENISMPALPDINMENAFQSKPAPKNAVISPKPGKPFQLKAVHCINALGLLWLCGIIFMLLKLGYGLAFIRGFRFGLNRIIDARVDRLLKIAAETFNKQRLPELYTSPQVESPVTIGMTNPIVIIPEKLFATLSENELKSILLHELAHIYHYDHIIGVFKRIIIAANWWNPLAYRVSAKHAVAREEVADNYVLRELNPKVYSECLAGLAEKICLISSYPAAAGMAGNYSSLQHRVKDIMSKKRKLTMTTGTTFKLTTAAVCLMLALAVAGCRCGKPDPEPLTADAIIAKMAETYAKCKTYQDSGVVKTVFIKAEGNRTDEKPFATAFVRPGQFCFEYKEKVDSFLKEKPCYIVWRKGDEVLTWFYGRQGTVEKSKSLGMGLAGATGVSGCSAHTVPALLMTEVGGRKLSEIKETKLLEDGMFDGVNCFRIQGKFTLPHDGKVVHKPSVIWIDKNSFLVRRIDEQTDFIESNFQTETTTTYYPSINSDIPGKALEFVPPCGNEKLKQVQSEDYAMPDTKITKDNSLLNEKTVNQIATSGYDLSAKQAAEMEQKLLHNPDDMETILKLLGYWHMKYRTDDTIRTKREKYILWVIEHHPDSPILHQLYGMYGKLDTKSNEVNEIAKKLWIEQIRKNPDNLQLLWNAGYNLFDIDKTLSEQCLKKGQSLDTEDPKWAEQLGNLYFKSKQKEPEKAFYAYKKAYPKTTNKATVILRMTSSAFDSGKLQDAGECVIEMQRLAETIGNQNEDFPRLMFNGNLTLGRIALKQGKTDEAGKYLLEAGKTPVSLRDGNPDFTLVKDLLAAGKKDVVVQFFQSCSQYWDKAKCDEWIKQINEGKTPKFKDDPKTAPKSQPVKPEGANAEPAADSKVQAANDYQVSGTIPANFEPRANAKGEILFFEPKNGVLVARMNVQADANGGFHISLPANSSKATALRAEIQFLSESFAPLRANTRVSPGKPWAVDFAEPFKKQDAVHYTGVFLDDISNEPVPYVGVYADSSGKNVLARADEKGRFDFYVVPSWGGMTSFLPWVSSDQYAGHSYFFKHNAGESVELKLIMERGVRVRVHTEDEQGVALPGVYVRWMGGGGAAGTTDEHGDAILSGMLSRVRPGELTEVRKTGYELAKNPGQLNAIMFTDKPLRIVLRRVADSSTPQASTAAKTDSAATDGKNAAVAAQIAKAKSKIAEKSKAISSDDFKAIEELYQASNKKWGTGEAKEGLKKLIEKYPKTNRAGCSMLYLGQMSQGDEQIKYLRQAIENYGDCYYYNGVQVGAYARCYLAWAYLQKGEKTKATQLLEEIKRDFPDAVDHAGNNLVANIRDYEKSGKSLVTVYQPIERFKAIIRMNEDSKIYSKDELKAIEDIYQYAGNKWGTDEAKRSLKNLIEKYPKANNAGCAMLDLGQMSQGDEQIKYLRQAIENYGDCYYGYDAHIGPYARYYLAWTYLQNGEKDKAAKLLEEIKTKFPNALDPRGNNLVANIANYESSGRRLVPVYFPQIYKVRAKVLARMEEESKIYSRDDQNLIWKLYSVANNKWGMDEAKESMKKLIERYPKSIYASWAMLYLGRMSQGDEQIKYLQQAIDNYGDSFFDDGVQVGAYARYCLAWAYLQKGEKTKAEALLEEFKKNFPDAVDHAGNNLVALIPREFQKYKAKSKMAEDSKTYSRDDLKKIGELCGIVLKQGNSPTAKESLNTLLTKYPKANSTGIALLHMGDVSKGAEQIKYLQQAIVECNDCFYGAGAQVGPYARLLLGRIYLKNDEKAKALKLLEEIKTGFPEACDKQGNRLTSVIAMMDIGGQEQSTQQTAMKEKISASYWNKFSWWQTLHDLQEKTGPINQKEQNEADALMQDLIKNVYLVKFKPVNNFNPLTPQEFLTNINKYSSLRSKQYSIGGASFFRTTDVNNQLIGSFLTEEPEQMKKDIEKNPSLQFLSSEKVTPETFVKHVESTQESLTEILKSKGPKILETIPPDGANNVDPNLTKIIIKFDRKMGNKGWSAAHVDGDESELPVDTNVSFDDSCTVITIPLLKKLQPNHTYAATLNGVTLAGFVSADGIQLSPHSLSFTTKATPETDAKTTSKEAAKPEAAFSMQDRAVKLAQTAAREWLALVDDGKYPESWTAASTLFKGAVTADTWTQMLKSGQTPFGKMLSRKLKNAVYRTSLPGAPDGQYVVIQYDTTFENKKDAVETVTPMLDKDGQWRVSGYYIK